MSTEVRPTPGSDVDWSERREDYALRFVPNAYRRWGYVSLTGIMLGIATAMFFPAWGGQLTMAYGTTRVLIAMAFGTLFIGGLGWLLARVASETGLDSDLITRGAGFGFMGSAITSLIYSFNFLMFFAFEGSIMGNAVIERFPALSETLVYLVIGLVFIPLTWYGLTTMNWLMWVTTPLYLGFLIWTIVEAASQEGTPAWWGYQPEQAPDPAAGPAMLALTAQVLALITQATIACDVGRFIAKDKRTVGSFYVGFVSQLVTFMGVVVLGGWLALQFGEADPGVYLAAQLGFGGVLFVVVTQLRINVSNVYSGSLAYANFFCRVLHWTPGRHWWVVLTTVLGTALMFGGIYTKLPQVLLFEGVFTMAWIMAIVSDIVVNKWLLKLSPPYYPYKRSQTYRYNPVGNGALAIALLVGIPLAFGVAGAYGKTLAPFISGGIAFALVPVIAGLTKGRYYVPPTTGIDVEPGKHAIASYEIDDTGSTDKTLGTCVKCRQQFELAEFAACPFHKDTICSVCCAAEARCGELCKAEAGSADAPAASTVRG